jgi:hypothetical protein
LSDEDLCVVDRQHGGRTNAGRPQGSRYGGFRHQSGKERVYFTRVTGNKMTMKSAPLIVPMTGATSVVDIELVKADDKTTRRL